MSEENLRDLCEELWQRPPTDQELQDVQRVKDLFGMKTTDSFFVALLAMHWFDGKARQGREEMVAAIEAATALQAAYAAVHPRRRGTRLSPSIAKQTLP